MSAAQTIVGKIGGVSNFIEIDETLLLGQTAQVIPNYLTLVASYINGASAVSNGINQWFVPSGAPITLASGNNVIYTLSALTDSLGRSLAMVTVRGWAIVVTSRTAGDYLTVGAAASHPWTAWGGGTTPTIKVFDFFCQLVQQTDGYAVAASTSDQIEIANSGSHSITFTPLFFGCQS